MVISQKIRILRFFFLVTSVLLMLCVIATPLLLGSQILPPEALVLDEDLLESVLITALFAIGASMYALYRRELRSLQRQLGRISSTNAVLKDRLTDAFRYIGTVNVQLQQVHAFFAEVLRYPESRNDFKRLLSETASKALCTVGKDWMLIRIVDRDTLKTRIEHWEARRNTKPPAVCIGNRAAMALNALPDVDVIRSQLANAAITTICVFPRPRLNSEERVLIEALSAELEMIYILFSQHGSSKRPTHVTAKGGSHPSM